MNFLCFDVLREVVELEKEGGGRLRAYGLKHFIARKHTRELINIYKGKLNK